MFLNFDAFVIIHLIIKSKLYKANSNYICLISESISHINIISFKNYYLLS